MGKVVWGKWGWGEVKERIKGSGQLVWLVTHIFARENARIRYRRTFKFFLK